MNNDELKKEHFKSFPEMYTGEPLTNEERLSRISESLDIDDFNKEGDFVFSRDSLVKALLCIEEYTAHLEYVVQTERKYHVDDIIVARATIAVTSTLIMSVPGSEWKWI